MSQAALDLGATPSAEPTPPCYLCRSTSAARSACPLCGKIVCLSCAERPYEFCCDGDGPPITPAEDPNLSYEQWARWQGDMLACQAHRLEREAREAETKVYLPRDCGGQRACEAYAARLREAAAVLRRPL